MKLNPVVLWRPTANVMVSLICYLVPELLALLSLTCAAVALQGRQKPPSASPRLTGTTRGAWQAFAYSQLEFPSFQASRKRTILF